MTMYIKSFKLTNIICVLYGTSQAELKNDVNIHPKGGPEEALRYWTITE